MLHGEIKVNDMAIGEWSATRGDSVGDGHHFYNCHVMYWDLQGYKRLAEFTVVYAEQDGAVVLAGKVLTESVHRLNRVFPE